MQGFTLLETLITIGIIIILAGIITTSWPRLRERQALVIAREQLQNIFRSTQQKALNEERDQDCIRQLRNVKEQRCSDIGIAFKDNMLRVFADTSDDKKPNIYTENDVLLEEHPIAAGVHTTATGDWQSFLFKAMPPTIELYDQNGDPILSPRKASLTIQNGSASRILYISPYGHVEE